MTSTAAPNPSEALTVRPTLADERRSASSRPLRALFLHRDLPFHGGVPRFMLAVARGCDPARVDVRIGAFAESSPEMVEAFGRYGVTPLVLGDRGYVGPARRLRRVVRGQQIDVLLCNSFKSYVVAKLATVGLRARSVFWIHAIEFLLVGRARKWLLRRLVRDDAIVSCSHAVVRAHVPADHRGPSTVIYHGIEDPYATAEHRPYPRSHRAELGLPDDAFVLCFTAEFIGWKDHATLLAAFDRLHRDVPGAHLILMGKGELFDETKAAAARLGSGANIHFLGPRADARRLLGVVDAYVHPSRGEGFGLAVVEAMLAERPVVVTRSGAFVEFVQDGVTGRLFEPGDVEGLANVLREVRADPEAARSIGARAREYCLTAFAPQRFNEDVMRLVEVVARG